MHVIYEVILAFSACLFSALGVWLLHAWIKHRAILDVPGERSNHRIPTPTGAGVAIMVSAIVFLFSASADKNILLGMVLLCAVSFLDDIRSLPVKQRLGAQAVAVILGISQIGAPVFQGLLPLWLDHVVVAGLWLWFINLYNFMDGIDELSITQTVSLCAGLCLLAWSAEDLPQAVAVDAAILAGAVIAFVPWNRHPAKMFMGDAGSIPLGFVLGFLLLHSAAAGYWQAALILPAYYLSDASYTLARRLLRGEKIWQAHSEHAYQKTVRAGRDHHDTSMHVLALNVVLIVLAVATILGDIVALVCLIAAYAASAALIVYFHRPVRVATAHVNA